jgi:hypothetical protein
MVCIMSRNFLEDLNQKDVEELDNFIFQNEKLWYLKKVRAITDCTLPEALYGLSERYNYLRSFNPNGFSESDKDYWAGFYS